MSTGPSKIVFSCPVCGHSYSVPNSAAGRRSRCAKCGEPVVVPEARPIPAVEPVSIPVVAPLVAAQWNLLAVAALVVCVAIVGGVPLLVSKIVYSASTTPDRRDDPLERAANAIGRARDRLEAKEAERKREDAIERQFQAEAMEEVLRTDRRTVEFGNFDRSTVAGQRAYQERLLTYPIDKRELDASRELKVAEIVLQKMERRRDELKRQLRAKITEELAEIERTIADENRPLPFNLRRQIVLPGAVMLAASGVLMTACAIAGLVAIRWLTPQTAVLAIVIMAAIGLVGGLGVARWERTRLHAHLQRIYLERLQEDADDLRRNLAAAQ
jgi:hypothetical protein